MRHLLRGLLLSLLGIIVINPLVAHAAIASPDSYGLTRVTIYSPAIETGDQLWLIEYNISYTVAPGVDSGEAWLIRIMDGATELGVAVPYPFYNDGYAPGVATVYFNAATAPAWSGNYTVSLEPNPLLVWTSIPAPAYFTSLTWSSAASVADVATAIGIRVRLIGQQLNIDWSASSDPIIEPISGIIKLTLRGESYFDIVFPTLRQIQPNLYTALLSNPIIIKPEYGDDYQQTVDAQLVGTAFDLTNFAADWGISRMWATGFIWAGLSLVVAGAFAYKAQTVKPTFALFGLMLIAGSFMGFGLLPGILLGLAGALAFVLAFAWRGA